MTPLVSVNLTTHNRAHLLVRCIESILCQSYPNIEIVIVDDASKDDTRAVVSHYQSRDKRIKYHRHETNQGISIARNTAWANSAGHYIAFMDDDDEWIDLDKIKKQVECFEKDYHKALAIVCSSVRLYLNESQYADKIISVPKDLKSKILSGNGIIYSPTVMTPKAVLDEVGGFDINLSRGVDSDFYRTCVVKYGYKVYFMPDVTTAIYEYGDDRITPVQSREKIKETLSANLYVTKKYFRFYFCRPLAFLRRLKTMGLLMRRLFFKC